MLGCAVGLYKMEDSENSSNGSNAILWEAAKADLEDKVVQDQHQIQCLKTSLRRLPASQHAVSKKKRTSKYYVKKLLKSKKFWKALDAIKCIALKSKLRGRRRKAFLNSRGYSSTMNFQVFTLPGSDIQSVFENPTNHKQPQQKGVDKIKHNYIKVRDQIVQTEGPVLENNVSQTNMPVNTSTNSIRNNFDTASSQMPMFVAPHPFNYYMHGIAGAGSTCSGNCQKHACSSSPLLQAQQHQQSVSECLSTNKVQNNGSQYSLNQICDRLLVLLHEKNNVYPNGTDSAKNICLNKRQSEIENSLEASEALCTNKVTDVYQSLPSNIRILTVNQMATGPQSSVVSRGSKAVSTEIATIPGVVSKICSTIQKPSPSADPVGVTNKSATPDLLRESRTFDSSNNKDSTVEENANTVTKQATSCSQNLKCQKSESATGVTGSASTLAEVFKSKNQNVGVSRTKSAVNCMLADIPCDSHSENGLHSQNDVNHLEKSDVVQTTINLGNVEYNAAQTESLKIVCSQSQTSLNIASSIPENMSHDEKSCKMNLNGKIDEICAKTLSRILFPDSGGSNCNGLTDPPPDLSKIGNMTKDGGCSNNAIPNNVRGISHNSTFRPVSRTDCVISEGSSHRSIANKPSCSETREPRYTMDGEETVDQELKTLRKVKNSDVSNIPRKQGVNSPAFEEIDSSEMENILQILSQQEHIHQDTATVKRISPTVFIKGKGKPRELPPELRVVNVLQPSLSSGIKANSSSTSLLDKLDEENKTLSDNKDDDDVSENSPRPVTGTAKRRKLMLRQNLPGALPVVFEKSKEARKERAESTLCLVSSDKTKTSPSPLNEEDTKENNIDIDDIPLARKCSKRLMNLESNKKSTLFRNSGLETKQKKIQTDKISEKKKKSSRNDSMADDFIQNLEADISVKGAKTDQSPDNFDDSDQKSVEDAENTYEKSMLFKDQIKERNDKLKQQWILEKSKEVFCAPASVSMSCSQSTNVYDDVMMSLEKMPQLKDVPVLEIAKAHDLAVHVILNPWRGFNVKSATRGFICPDHDAKIVSRALWELRKNGCTDTVLDSILALGWKNFHEHAVRSMASLFILSFTRRVGFAMELKRIGDDDTASICSEFELPANKKVTPVRLVASRQIFKGEFIYALNGLLMKVSVEEKDKLRSWVVRKFKQDRTWGIFGPLAYIKRKEDDFNTVAVRLEGELIGVIASRNILLKEELITSQKALEQLLPQ